MSSCRTLSVVVLSILVGCTKAEGGTSASASPTKQEAGRVVHLSAQAFRKLSEQTRGIYLDVRTPAEVARGHVPNASVIDFYDPKFRVKVDLLQKDKPIFVYCASGKRSGAAAEMMVQMGFTQVYDLEGGIAAWSNEGYPMERSATADDGAKGMEPERLDALLRANHRVLVAYQTPWCGPCRAMRPVVDAVAEAWRGRALVLHVDLGESEALAAREKIQGVPVFIVYVDSQERWRGSGEIPREALETALAKP